MPETGIQIQAEDRLTTIKKHAPRKHVSPDIKNAKLKKPLIVAAGCAALLVLGIGAALFFSGDDPVANVPVGAPGAAPTGGAVIPAVAQGSKAEAEVVIDWDEADRKGGGVTIDGQRQQLPDKGAVRYGVAAGEHRLVLQRRGYEPLEVVLSLRPGDNHSYSPKWSKSFAPAATGWRQAAAIHPVGFPNWNQNFSLAQKNAKQRGAQVMLVFAGSDWEHFTQHLSEQVFAAPQFLEQAKEKFELVVIDFPRTREGFNLVEDRGQNSHLQRQFRISRVPTVALTDEEGVPYAVERPEEDVASVSRFWAWLEKLSERRQRRDELLQAAATGEDAARLEACVAAVEWLEEQKLVLFYKQPIDQWLQVAQRADPNNELGRHEAVFQAHWLNRLLSSPRSPTQLKETVAALDQWVSTRKFQDHDRAAGVYLAGAAMLMQVEDEETAMHLAAEAAKYTPKDKELAENVAALSAMLKDREQLGSGTGFVVAEKGYILTNHHVIEGKGRVVIRLTGREEPVPATVVQKDEDRDLALLKIAEDAAAGLKPIAFEQAALSRGARVAAFGYPLGDIVGSGIKLTTGVVSALPEANTEGMLLLDCRVNPGNSGGPLCNTRGQIVGIVTAKSFIGESVDSYGMAVPTSDILPFLTRTLPELSTPVPKSDAPALEWDQVDALVSPSVVMVLKVR